LVLIEADREWTGAAGGSPILFPNVATTCIDSACGKQDPLFALQATVSQTAAFR